MTLMTNQAGMSYNANGKCFVIERSMLPAGVQSNASSYTLKSHKTGEERVFVYSHADTDRTHEDCYGWNYVCIINKQTVRLLIIND